MVTLATVRSSYKKGQKQRVKDLLKFLGPYDFKDFKGMEPVYYAYLIISWRHPTHEGLYVRLKDEDMSRYADYLDVNMIIGIIEDEEGDTKKFFIDLLRHIDIESYLNDFTPVLVAISLGIYDADDLLIEIILKEERNLKLYKTFTMIIQRSHPKNLIKIYNLAVEYNRSMIVDYLNTVILKQV